MWEWLILVLIILVLIIIAIFIATSSSTQNRKCHRNISKNKAESARTSLPGSDGLENGASAPFSRGKETKAGAEGTSKEDDPERHVVGEASEEDFAKLPMQRQVKLPPRTTPTGKIDHKPVPESRDEKIPVVELETGSHAMIFSSSRVYLPSDLGVSKEQFDKMVEDYKEKQKPQEAKIPRHPNFNFEKYKQVREKTRAIAMGGMGVQIGSRARGEQFMSSVHRTKLDETPMATTGSQKAAPFMRKTSRFPPPSAITEGLLTRS